MSLKKSRKSVQLYSLNSDAGPVELDLNNYTAVCSVTKEPKQFHHSYLANLIATKFDNNISLFESTYVSRVGLAEKNVHVKAAKLEDRISALYTKIRALKIARDELALTN
jgi:hypothetical protein